MNMICRVLGHHRSGRFASFNFADDRWESVCTRCKVRLARQHGGGWHQISGRPSSGVVHLAERSIERPPAEVA